MIKSLSKQLVYFTIVAFICCILSCNNKKGNSSVGLSGQKDSLALLIQSIEKNVSQKGVIAWLDYFQNSPDFFMASDGKLAFHTYDSAKAIIEKVLVKNISKISLQFANVYIDVLTTAVAGIAADFQEEIIAFSGKKISVTGYFTAITQQTQAGWKLRSLHWSIIHEGQ